MSNEAAGSSSHWEKSKRLLFITLAIWAFFSFVVHWFGSALNGAEDHSPAAISWLARARRSPSSF